MNNEYLLLIGALRVFDNFTVTNCQNFKVKHDTASPDFNILHSKYPIRDIAGDGTDFSKTIKLMRWVHDNVLHNGGTKDVEFVPKNSVSILDYSFGKGIEFGVYCRLQAIVLTECCLSIGLMARTIHCLPFSPNDFDSHVVSMVYIKDLKKWVLFDPGNNAYFTDKNQTPCSPLEARSLLGRNECFVSDQLKPNYVFPLAEKQASYKQYMAKNLFYIKFSAINTFGTDLIENQITYHLIPLGFNAKEREISYCEYAIDNAPDNLQNDWRNSLGKLKTQTIITVSQEQFECC
ncbi:MAG: transglutaminase-like domain-containing protein [Clostridiales bacterium]|jgi:hypothetical protein|nr:transglutaminase-like domain-containing protein [Clostridiales bacterium]